MIDWDRVVELQTEIGEEDFIEVGRMFIAEIRDKLEEMSIAPTQTSADYHYLRGSAANLGLIEFADLCGQAEGAARTNQSPDFDAVCDCFNRSVTEVEELFSS